MAGPSVSGTPLVGESTVWSSRILEYLDKTFVYVNAFTNRDYEGEARKGGTVKIFRVNAVSVEDHDGAWDDTDWDDLGQTEVEFQIDQEKRFLFKVPLVRENFNVLNLIEQGSQRAAVAIGDTIDQYIAGKYTQIASGNAYGTTGSPITIGFGSGEVKPTIALARLRELIVTAKAPTQNNRIVVPEWFGTMLDIELGGRLTQLGDRVTTGDLLVRPGYMGSVAGFDIYVSPNVPNTTSTKYKVMAGAPMITMASAIDLVKTVDLQNDFGYGVKGLFVYGAKLLDTNAMALGTFNKGAYTA